MIRSRRFSTLAKAALPGWAKKFLRPEGTIPLFSTLSFAQDGEDKILARLFSSDRPDSRPGFYVDVGAHHPERFSNTSALFRRGWRGINIDPLPGSMAQFAKARPSDINLEIGISSQPQMLTYYAFNEPALNGFSASTSAARDKFEGATLLSKTDVQTLPLADVLNKHVPSGVQIDLLNVDVEGLDLDVLKSNDWSRFRPIIIMVEDMDILTLSDVARSAIATFLARQGYDAYCKTPLTTFFILSSEVQRGPLGMRLPRFDGSSSTNSILC